MEAETTSTAPRYDKEINVALGNSRTTKHWKNRKIKWSELCARLAKPTVTPELFTEYKGMSRPERANVKDVGGFVGGVLAQGRRQADAVSWRTLITLDVDTPVGDPLAAVKSIYSGFGLAVYSTHSHAPAKPRIRIIIPMSRPVSPDEYQAISRELADRIGMDQFDDSTYQPERLMFWPSVSRDMADSYIYYVQDLPFLNPDDVLKLYFDWQDSTEWPTSSREHDVILKRAKQQGDPLEKPGNVGLFNRTYTIPEAIEKFLSDEYEPFTEDRYTYLPGSAVGGLVLYQDDTFAYSHHGTDPTGGRLCNAFDLVRIHLFGEEDVQAAAGTAVNKLPSYKSMERFMLKDGAVKRQIIDEQQADASNLFDDLGDTPEKPETVTDPDLWKESLTVNQYGRIESTARNIRLVLENDKAFAGALANDLFGNRMMVLKPMPWDKSTGRYWSNMDDSCLRNYLEEHYNIRGKDRIYDVLVDVMNAHAFHPVRDYLNGLEWDGVERLDKLFIDKLQVPDTEFVRTVTRKAFVAAVARVFQPGVPFHTLVVLVGPQGAGKSLILRKMARSWFTDSLRTVDGKEAMEVLQGAWLVEIGEMAATKRAETETIKQFIAKGDDSFRPAYGRHKETYSRQCVFFGTTNTHYFLRDTTGNRRYWPIETKKNDHGRRVAAMTNAEIDQLWAEAKKRYDDGETLYLDDRMTLEAEKVQADFLEVSPVASMIEDFAARDVPDDWAKRTTAERRVWLEQAGTPDDLAFSDESTTVPRDRISAIEIWCECLGNAPQHFERRDAREINDVLESLPDWQRADKPIRVGRSYGPQRGFMRKGGSSD